MNKILIVACLLMLAGCTGQESTTPTDPPVKEEPVAAAPIPWKLDLGSYFTVDTPPQYFPTEQHYVMVVVANGPGGCAVESDEPTDFFGFEAVLYDASGKEIHRANDVGSATRDAAPAADYQKRAPDRVLVDPVQWKSGTRVRITIAPDLDPETAKQANSGSISAI